jgi:importin subunit beta-1
MENVQSFICSTLQSTCVKLPSTTFTPELISMVVTTVLDLFKARQTVVEEGIQALGALAQTVDMGFEPHLQAFGPFLVWALKKQDEVSVCKAGTMCVGDIARALNDKITPFLPDLIPLLLTNLEKADISTDIKIQTIASLADLASNSRGAFLQYLPGVLHYVDQAAEASATPVKEAENPDLWEYLIELREAILQFYVGLLQGLGEAKQQDQILGYVPKIVDFALFATQEVLRPTHDMHVNALGLLGDIAVAFGERVKSVVLATQVMQYVQRWANSPNPRVHEVAIWAQSAILGNKP